MESIKFLVVMLEKNQFDFTTTVGKFFVLNVVKNPLVHQEIPPRNSEKTLKNLENFHP
jgi:hypothetical protein